MEFKIKKYETKDGEVLKIFTFYFSVEPKVNLCNTRRIDEWFEFSSFIESVTIITSVFEECDKIIQILKTKCFLYFFIK